MQKNQKIYNWSTEKIIDKLKFSLSNNLINITSTDTIPGLLANTTKESFEKLNEIKKERENKPYLILISSKEKIKCFVGKDSITPGIENLIKNCWPGPVTVIFKAKQDLPSFLKSNQNTVALRCPKHENLLKILESFDGLFSTSANISGEKSPTNISQIDEKILYKIDYIVDNQKQYLENVLPSTIIDASKPDVIQIIRKGQYNIKIMEKNYGKKFKK